MTKFFLFLAGLLCLVKTAYGQPATPIWLDDLAIKSFSEGIPAVLPKVTAAGVPMRMKGRLFERGVGVNATSVLAFFLAGNAREFSAVVGVDDNGQRDLPHTFYVIGDEKILFTSGAMRLGDEPKSVKVDVTGIQRLGLLVLVDDIGRTKLYSNWADAQLLMIGQHQPQQIPNTDEKYILTPLPAPKPKINSASIFGATPGNPFLYTIAATGNRPMQFSATNLPRGLTVDAKTGIISGKVAQRGTYVVTLKARNALGEASKKLTIKIGDTIALTPPIGWNGWNSWAKLIDREKVVASARAMVNMGLSQHGWTYINIDDAWQGPRGGAYNAIMPNEKFPKFKEMVDEIHGLGLKVGVYSTPWVTSYAGYPGGSAHFANGFFPDSIRANHRAHRFIGKYRFETADARQMAEWGIDFLKYDWRLEVPSAERMATALRQSGRDIVYSISNSAPFAQVNDWVRLTNTFRTGPDIRDSWTSLYRSAFTLDKWAPYGGPGHWLDPDMMILGNVTTGSQLHPTRLTPDEQYSHVSIFSLLSAPLLIGCPIEQLDAFTLNLLTNDEVIAINQDPLGKSARLLVEENGVQIWVKPLEEGSFAVGLFNVADFGKTPQSYFRWGNEKPRDYSLDLAKIGLTGKYKLRDVWRQKDLGVFTGSFQTAIRHHGVVMLKVIPVN
ncbi:NPCBM/NEW2 domain-containing protein [Larkinella arboricola]